MSETVGSDEMPEFNFDDLPSFEQEDTSSSSDQGAAPASSDDGQNPAWEGMLSKIPKEFHSQILPDLQNWDRGVQQRFQKIHDDYKPYEPLRQNNVSMEQLQQGMQLLQQINQSPVEFFNNMKQLLMQQGMMPQEAAQVAAEMTEARSDEDDDEVYHDPRIDELQQTQQQMIDAMRQQYEAEQTQQQYESIHNDLGNQMEALQGRVGKMPEWLQVEIFNRAGALSDRAGRPVTLVEAYSDWQKMASQFRRPGQSAPRVVPSGGGIPQQMPSPDALKSQQGRMEAGQAIANRFRNN